MADPGRVSGPNTRNDAPTADDWGMVVRPIGGSVTIDQPSLATVTAIPVSVVSVTLQAANPLRRGLLVNNDSTQTLYVKIGAGASLTDFSLSLCPGQTYEAPFPVGTTEVSGIWVAAGPGNARVTELTVP